MEGFLVALVLCLLPLPPSHCGRVALLDTEIIPTANPLILNEQTDLIYLLPKISTSLHILTTQVSLYQTAFVFNESAFLNNNVQFSKDFSVTTVLVQKSLTPSNCNEIFNPKRLNMSQLTWIFSSREYLTEIPPNLKLMDQLYYFQNSSTIKELYKIKELLIEQEVNSESILSRRMNLRQQIIQAAHVRQPSFISKSGRETIGYHNWRPEELTYQKMAFMQDLLHFSVRFQNVNFWVTSTTTDGIGMADALRRSEADLALSNTAIWANMEFRFLFITRLYREVYVYYHPPSSSSHLGFEWVVQPKVWLVYGLIAGTLCLISPLFFSNWNFGEAFSWTVSVLTERGVKEPQSRFTISARCFFFTSFAFGLLFYVSLSSILISILSVKVEISGMEDLKRRGYSFGVWKDSILDDAFKLGHIPDKSPLAVAKSRYRTFPSEEEGAMEVVSHKKFAFISGQLLYLQYAEYIKKIGGCKSMKLFTLEGEKRWGSVFVPTSSPFTNHFNFARLRMSEGGIESVHLRNINRDTEAVKETCLEQYKSPQNRPIAMEEVVAIVYIYIAGLLVTIPIFILEYFTGQPGKVHNLKM